MKHPLRLHRKLISQLANFPMKTCWMFVFLFFVSCESRVAPHTDTNLNPVKESFNDIQDGDIIFQTSKSSQSKAIQRATKSTYSHMGIIYQINGKYFLYEAVEPVKSTPLAQWIKRGENSHYVIKRLKDRNEILTNEKLKKMKSLGEKYKGKNYDLYFEWSDNRIYWSELVWKIYKEAVNIELGKLQELREFDLTSETVKSIMKKRYGTHMPLDEKVISPAAMFNSDELITIISK